MSRFLRFAFPLLLVAGGIVWIQTAGRGIDGSPPPPRLFAPSCPLLLGRGKPGETLRGQFILSNIGGRPLEFALSAGCGCTELSPASGTISPGAEHEIEIGVALPSQYGTSRSFHVNIATNDDDQPQAEFLVRADCPPLFKTVPENLDFGTVSADESNEISFTVLDGMGRPLRDAVSLQIEADRQELTLQRLDSAVPKYRLQLKDGLAPGYFQGGLRLTHALSGESTWRPVSAYVRKDLVVAPRVISVPFSLTAPWERSFFVLRTDGKTLGKLTKFEGPSGVTVEPEQGGPSSRQEFRLIVLPAAAQNSPSVRLYFSGIHASADLRLRWDRGEESMDAVAKHPHD